MQPDQTRRPYPAFRAWVVRLVVYTAAAMVAVVAGVLLLGRLLPEGTPPLLAVGALLATGWVLGGFAAHVVTTLLHDRREAAWRELERDRAELRARYGLMEGVADGTD